MRRYFTDLEKLLLVLTAFTVGFFAVFLYQLWIQDPTVAHAERIAIHRVSPVIGFTALVWVILKLFFVN